MSFDTPNISIRDEGTPALRQFIAGLRNPTRLHQAVARSVSNAMRDYIVSHQSHATASRLGASSSGFLAHVADTVSGRGEADAAVISMHPAMARAFRNVTITAGTQSNAEHLTIPLAAASYGNRIRKGRGSRFKGFFLTSKKGNLLYAIKGADKRLILLYLLKKQVTQKQDRSLMPSDSDIKRTALLGAVEYVDGLIARKSNS
jgi:hypothetical protein